MHRPFAAHKWAIKTMGSKLVDLMSDFGTFFINYGVIGDKSNRFYKLYEEEKGNDVDRIRIIVVVSLILSTLTWFPDAYYSGKFAASTQKEGCWASTKPSSLSLKEGWGVDLTPHDRVRRGGGPPRR